MRLAHSWLVDVQYFAIRQPFGWKIRWIFWARPNVVRFEGGVKWKWATHCGVVGDFVSLGRLSGCGWMYLFIGGRAQEKPKHSTKIDKSGFKVWHQRLFETLWEDRTDCRGPQNYFRRWIWRNKWKPAAFVSEYDLVYWYNWFTETKKNRAKKKFKKGFVEIKFGSKSKQQWVKYK